MLYRSRIITTRNLQDPLFRLLELFISIYSWDPKYRDNYEEVEITDRELAEFLNWSQPKVTRTRNSLIKLNFIKKVARGTYTINNLDTLVHKKNNSLHKDNVEMHNDDASMNQNSGYESDSPLVSSKDDLNLDEVIIEMDKHE